jgi:transposase
MIGMSVPLSLDLRSRILKAYLAGEGSFTRLAARFGVGEASVNRILRLHRETGKVEPRPHGGGQTPLIGPDDAEALAELVQSHPDGTIDELTAAWNKRMRPKVTHSSMLRALHRFGFTPKERPSRRARPSARKSKKNAKRSRI